MLRSEREFAHKFVAEHGDNLVRVRGHKISKPSRKAVNLDGGVNWRGTRLIRASWLAPSWRCGLGGQAAQPVAPNPEGAVPLSRGSLAPRDRRIGPPNLTERPFCARRDLVAEALDERLPIPDVKPALPTVHPREPSVEPGRCCQHAPGEMPFRISFELLAPPDPTFIMLSFAAFVEALATSPVPFPLFSFRISSRRCVLSRSISARPASSLVAVCRGPSSLSSRPREDHRSASACNAIVRH